MVNQSTKKIEINCVIDILKDMHLLEYTPLPQTTGETTDDLSPLFSINLSTEKGVQSFHSCEVSSGVFFFQCDTPHSSNPVDVYPFDYKV